MQRPDQVGGHNHSGPLTATPRPVARPWAWGGEVLNLPNAITFARLCAVPVAVWLVLGGRMAWALAVFAAAGASDALDGWLARRRGGTVLGAWMDPAADKALLVSMFVALAATGLMPVWMAGLVVWRDLVILCGIALMWWRGRTIRIRPLLLGKINTAVQILLVCVIMSLESLGLLAPGLRMVLLWLTAATTVASGVTYVWRTSRPPEQERLGRKRMKGPR